jgi:tetratricopeptide (TPR) repeat protein
VLQNFGVPLWPRWHYAVVVGFDRDADRVLLRSGTRERLQMRRTWFESSWRRASRWAVVAVLPDEVPASATAERYLRAAADLESVARRDAAARAYAAAVSRWPENPLARAALANARLAGGDSGLAERTLRDAVAAGAADAIVHNNLADLLAKRGCRDSALAQLRLAEDPGAPIAAAVQAAIVATRREIEAMSAGASGAEPADCAPATAAPAR